MMGRRAFVFAALLCLVSLAAFAANIKFPPLTGRVVDEAHLLSPAATQQLTQELAGFEQKTGDQVVVAILSSLQGQEIEDYGYQLGRFWGIGQKDKNNGAILIVAPKERKVRIEVGYGLEGTLTDAQSNQIIYQIIIPHFKAGEMEQGVVAGTEAILGVLGDKNASQGQSRIYSSQVAALQPYTHASPASIIATIVLLIIFMILRLVFGWWFIPFGFGFGGGSFGGGGGGFSGGGGSFGGGGASGSW